MCRAWLEGAFPEKFLARLVLDYKVDDLDAHLVGVLDRIGENLAFLDRLLAIRHPIETDDLDPVLAVGLLHGSISPNAEGSLMAKMAAKSSWACRAADADS